MTPGSPGPNPTDSPTELDLPLEMREKLIKAARNIISHGKIVQVDAGEYGPNPPTNVWHPKNTKFGSIDKTNMFGAHADERSLVEETWLWDDRNGLQKPERFSKIIAENLTRLLGDITREKNGARIVKLRDEKIQSIYNRKNLIETGDPQQSHVVLNGNAVKLKLEQQFFAKKFLGQKSGLFLRYLRFTVEIVRNWYERYF